MDLSNLLSQSQNMALVLDSMAEAIIAHDLERNITFFNRAAERLTGLRREAVMGKDCHEVIQGGLCGSQCAFCERCIPDFELLTYPLLITDSGGREHHVEMTVVPVTDRSGQIVGVVASARDVTELTELRRALKRERSFQGIIGRHHRMQSVYELVREVAQTDVPVLVQGESGTGKELVAAAIHAQSSRAGCPFVAVNCSALSEGLLESELFGHVKGAFTGAVRDKRGRFELANNGTIFLDEVGELSPAIQVKLLRVLQQKRFERVGAESSIDVDVRVISATNRNLREMVKRGSFRQDLYFRMCVVPVELPALRDRRTDIALLIEHFLERFGEELDRPVPALTDAARAALMKYAWPGNVRELMNALQYAMVMAHGGKIDLSHLPAEMRPESTRRRDQKKRRMGRRRKLTVDEVKQAIEENDGSRTLAARQLGVGRSTLYRYLREEE